MGGWTELATDGKALETQAASHNFIEIKVEP